MDGIVASLFRGSAFVSLAGLAASMSQFLQSAPPSSPFPTSAAALACILRFTLVAWNKDTARSAAATTPDSDIPVDQTLFLAWFARFSGAPDLQIAVRNAAALFTPSDKHGGALILVPWYHGLASASATEAGAVLKGSEKGTFLIRVSASEAGCFTASYITPAGSVLHTRIVCKPAGYLAAGAEAAQPTLPAVVSAFSSLFSTPLPSPLAQASLLLAASVRSSSSHYVDFATAPPMPAAAPTILSTDSVVETTDIMISYQWDEQPLVRRICAALREDGFIVWLDETHMASTYVKSMVKAVRGARCILIVATSKYIASSNCTTEASLAYEHRSGKAIIIANPEPGFYPAKTAHEVAALAAGQLYCNFQKAAESEEGFQAGMADVRRQLAAAGITPSGVPGSARGALTHAQPPILAREATIQVADAPAPVLIASSANPAASGASTGAGYQFLPAVSNAYASVEPAHESLYGAVPVDTSNPYSDVPDDSASSNAYGAVA